MKAKLFIVVIIAVAFFSGCENQSEKLEGQIADLKQINTQLMKESTFRDAYIDSVAQAINGVYANIETMKSNEQHLLKEKQELETAKKLTGKEIRERLIERVNEINTVLQENQKNISTLQKKLASYRTKYAGLQKMVETLKATLAEREQSINELTIKIQGLENTVAEKSRLIENQKSLIGEQHQKIATAYYVVGKREELEKKGIISKEGGFLWGLLGSTTILSSGLDETVFKSINKEEQKVIEFDGKIHDLIPKRNPSVYSAKAMKDSRTTITIADPAQFWESKYLVIITD